LKQNEHGKQTATFDNSVLPALWSLKCMYVLDTGQKPKTGHDWVKLFEALKPHTRVAPRHFTPTRLAYKLRLNAALEQKVACQQ